MATKRSKRWWCDADYPIPGSIVTRDGLIITTRDYRWRVTLDRFLNWRGSAASLPAQLTLPLKAYISHILTLHSGENARAVFDRLTFGLSKIGRGQLTRYVSDGIGIDLFYALKARLENDPNMGEGSVRDSLSIFRRWYTWCADCELPGFDDEVAFALAAKRIGGSVKGRLVLQADSEMGPLSFIEDTRLEAAITVAYERIEHAASGELQAVASVMLSKAFGLYGKHLQLMNEDDYEVEQLSDGSEIHWISIPRVKKRGARRTVGARKRRITGVVGETLARLIEENAKNRDRCDDIDQMTCSRPLFVREKGRSELSGTVLQGDSYRLSTREFLGVMRDFCQCHCLNFHVTPRRLRYSFATRLVEEGCSPLELADALDHTDLQYVMVYFNAKGRIVRQLDEAMAIRLAPLALAFLGRVVGKKAQATRGDDPTSTIRFMLPAGDQPEVGSCGQFRHCGLNAPLACYTCHRFEPWKDAPHDLVLAALVVERRRRIALGMDEKIVQIHDQTILAVADVVQQIRSEIQAEGESPPW